MGLYATLDGPPSPSRSIATGRTRRSILTLSRPSARVSSNFLGAIGVLPMHGHFRRPNAKLLGKSRSQCLGQISHRIPVAGALFKKPLADLASAIRRLALFDHPGLKLLRRFVEDMTHLLYSTLSPHCRKGRNWAGMRNARQLTLSKKSFTIPLNIQPRGSRSCPITRRPACRHPLIPPRERHPLRNRPAAAAEDAWASFSSCWALRSF